MQEKKFLKIILITSDILLLFVLIGLLVTSLPQKWWQKNDIAISQNDETGNLTLADVIRYSPIYKDYVSETDIKLSGASKINRSYLSVELYNLSAQYIRTYGSNTKTELKKTVSSSTDFCYTILGAPNGEEWDVWIVLTDNDNAMFTVVKREVTSK